MRLRHEREGSFEVGLQASAISSTYMLYAQRPTVDRVLWPAPNRDREALLPLPLTLAAAAVFFSATPPLPVKLPPHGRVYLADKSPVFLPRRHVAALVRCISDSLARHRAASPASRLIPSGAPRLTPPVSETSPRYHILLRRRPWYFFEARSAKSAESKFSLRTDLRSLSTASSAPAHARNSARTAALTRDGRRPWYFFEARSAEVEARSAESKFSLRTDVCSLSAASSAPAHARNSATTAPLTRGASSIHSRAPHNCRRSTCCNLSLDCF